MTSFAPLLQAFFTDRLITQRRVSPHTIAAYRDSFRLLLSFAAERTGRTPSRLDLADIDAVLVAAFLDHLERERHNSIRTRNARLVAVHSLFSFAALREPGHAGQIQRVLAIPQKRFDRAIVSFLDQDEIDAIVAAPDRTTWLGRRDHALLLMTIQTGLRASELTGLRRRDVSLGKGAHVTCTGKGRKQRATPLTKATMTVLRSWLEQENRSDDAAPLFPTRQGTRLSLDAVERLVSKHAAVAVQRCPSLAHKHVTPHVLRHTTAMELLAAGVDTSVIALWLGHESTQSTQIYLHADMAIKERALNRIADHPAATVRYHAPDTLLAFLDGL
jgi:integrase/recombinase XerD